VYTDAGITDTAAAAAAAADANDAYGADQSHQIRAIR